MVYQIFYSFWFCHFSNVTKLVSELIFTLYKLTLGAHRPYRKWDCSNGQIGPFRTANDLFKIADLSNFAR